ncbi:alpha/beta hydrolase [Actinophytocola gossypii]|uniref:Alpha/beta fold hydrolase n=1 Tax=Actinophytocola gossypii TaxID=2812003 RepID=A0ABT2JHM9_9PSEU|nr:alpha/beta hydrolase [Actinophytocola gossypii]MCT2587384.1 alpha/beta fold hydrolase [Actinophytocola gossypii]
MILALVAAGCTSSVDGASGPELPFEESAGPAGEVPDGLDEFYGQALTWEKCVDYASSDLDAQPLADPAVQCTHLTVPLDYTDPGGETIRIGVLRRPASNPAERIGSLLINPGGPGVAGLSTAAALGAENDDLAARFDFVGFDPRGVGSSEPTIECLTGDERDADRADDVEIDATGAGVTETEQENRDYATKCVERTEFGEEMLANLGTRDVVKDMDVLRSALGDEKLTYLGFSYGTRIGSTYAETFPENVRAMVLDGAVDPTKSPEDEVVAQGKGFQEAFDDFVAWCVDQGECPFDSAATATTAFQDLTRPLADNPIELPDGRPLSYEDATTGVIQALYSQQLWEHLKTGLTELSQGQGSTLMSLADLYLERGRDGEYSTTQDAFVAIRCVDDPRITEPAQVRFLGQRYLDAAPFLDHGNPPSPARDSCAFWPVPNTGEPHLPDVEGIPPVLVISTTGDPATPYQAGVALADALGGALLTYEATQHTVFLQGNPCVDDAGTAYLVDGTVPGEGTRCQP